MGFDFELQTVSFLNGAVGIMGKGLFNIYLTVKSEVKAVVCSEVINKNQKLVFSHGTVGLHCRLLGYENSKPGASLPSYAAAINTLNPILNDPLENNHVK